MRAAQTVRDDIINCLTNVIDPELGVDIVNLGLVYSIDLDQDGICLIKMTLTTMGCPLTDVLTTAVTAAVKQVPEVKNVDVRFVWKPTWTPQKMSRSARIALGIHYN